MRTSLQSSVGNSRAGFTLVELMIVVSILGILAAVSLPALSSYIYKSKAVEATGFLNEIKARQESYRADFGQYCDASGTQGNFFPQAAAPLGTSVNWPNPLPAAALGWTALGAVPPGRSSRFVYSTVAGTPGTMPGAVMLDGNNRGYTGVDFWFVSTALGDLDGDGINVTFESYSHSKALWTDNASGWE